VTAPIRWGILGTGSIARKMAEAINSLPDAELAAVGSRAKETAEKFGEEFNIPRRHASYEELARDAEVDIIYVATPHNFHKANSILCMEHGKAVLCEKPFALNASEAEQMIRMARTNRVFLMEAIWTRFLPTLTKCREALAQGTIGEVRMVQADFGFRAGWNPEGRLLNPNLAGGGLLDVGVYTVSLASMVLGEPKRLATLAHIGETGVDEQCGVILGYDGGRLAVLSSAVRTTTPMEADILGTDGMIRLHSPWWRGSQLSIVAGGKTELIDAPFGSNGFEYQATEAMTCLRQGKLESSIIPLEETLSIMQTLDAIRAQWGLKYPME
jgi:predicted dehydrogenase